MGASGSGVTTLGRAIATDWSVPAHDTDDYYWLPTDPPYQDKRPIPERIALMETLFLPRAAWVLSGSLFSWAAPMVPHFDAVVFVSLDNEWRLERLKAREIKRYGDKSLTMGSAAVQKLDDFLAWARQYEDPNFTGRSRASHEQWLAGLDCKVIRVDSARPVSALVDEVNGALAERL